jgi:DNA-binding transcriptional LysR family regulator
LADLADHGVIAYTHFAMGNEWQFDGPDGSETVRTRSSARCNNGDTCRSIALSGAGIALQPSFMVAEDLRSGAWWKSCRRTAPLSWGSTWSILA